MAYDTGEAIFGHTFGAYFGLGVAKIINLKGILHNESEYETSSYQSDIISMLGTLFLWIYWVIKCCVIFKVFTILKKNHYQFLKAFIQLDTI